MKKVILMFALLASAMSTSIAFAEPAVEPVTSTGAAGPNCALIQVTPGHFNSGGWLAIDVTNPGGRAMYSAALTAIALNRKVFVNRVSVASPGCFGLTDYASDVRVLNY